MKSITKKLEILSLDEPKKARKTGLVFHKHMMSHTTHKDLEKAAIEHPENPKRMKFIIDHLEMIGLSSRCEVVQAFSSSSLDLIEAIHGKKYPNEVKGLWNKYKSEKEWVDNGDTYFNGETYNAALLAVQAGKISVDNVCGGLWSNAFLPIRPPGHHAGTKGTIQGFCFFNTVAIIAKYAQKKHKVQRVLILDWDVHHGDSTQHFLYDDPSVLYVSLHRFDKGSFYPGDTGALSNTGKGKGEGFNINFPWDTGTDKTFGDQDYLYVFERCLLPIFEDFKPDLVLVSCGFDSGRGDPLGGMDLTQDGYAYMTRRLMGLAKGKVIVVLEGGYNFETLAVSSEAVLRTLLGEELPLKNSISNLKTEETLANLLPKHRTMTHAENFLTTHAKYRPFLKTKPVLLKLEQEVLRRIIKGSKRDDKFITSGKPEKFIFDQKTVMKKLTLTEKDFYQRAKTCDFAQIIPEFSGSVFVSGKGEYIRLENLFFQMENASIVEVKLGFDPNSNKKGDPKSQIKNKQKALATSSQRLGFRIQGFIFKDEQGEIASRQCKGSLYLDRQEEDFIEIFDGLLMSNERKNENMEAAEYFLGFVRKVKEICEKEIFDVSGVSLVFLVDNTRKTQGFCSKMIGFGNCMQSKEIKEKTKAALGNLEEYFCKLLKYVQDLNLN